MGKLILAASAAIAASICASAAAAASETYTVYLCEFVVRGSGGEQSKILFAIDKSNKAFTYQSRPGSDQPVRLPVSMRNNGPVHVIYSYAYDVPNADGQTGRFDVQARIPKAGGASRVSIQGRGYANGPSGNGTCTLERDMRLPY